MLAVQMLGFSLDLAPDPVFGIRLAETPLETPVHSGAKLLLACWRSASGTGGLTVGRDLPSRKLSSILANLVLFEYCGDAGDFRVRLAGFSLMRRFGRDIARRLLREILPREDHGRHKTAMLGVMRTGAPFSLDVRLTSPDLPMLHYEMLTVGARDADGKTPLVLSGLFFFDGARTSLGTA